MVNTEFPISIYGEAQKVNDVLTKARCRIFYKYGNRNGTYITDEFAEELISSLHYVPVKGIYGDEDFTDHGMFRSEGRIYGIVPEQNNFAWEDHQDEDGVMRTYACSDVYLFTALYPEAATITGKGQSMELYAPSLKYHYQVIDNSQYIVFEHGSFLGLQVLGDKTEPCFEGASFFSLQESIETAINKIKMFTKGGTSPMTLNFALSDREKFDLIWEHVNPNYNEEGGWQIRASVCEIYDDYALVYEYDTGKYVRIGYTKTEEGITFSEEVVPVRVIDVTESEYEAVEKLRHLNGDTYAEVNENLLNAETNASLVVDLNSKIEEKDASIATLQSEAETNQSKLDELNTQVSALEGQCAALKSDNEVLVQYKLKIEGEQKDMVIDQYVSTLDKEVIDAYRANKSDYTLEELDMRLAYEMKKSGKMFSNKKDEGIGYVIKNSGLTGVEEILSHYKK